MDEWEKREGDTDHEKRIFMANERPTKKTIKAPIIISLEVIDRKRPGCGGNAEKQETPGDPRAAHGNLRRKESAEKEP